MTGGDVPSVPADHRIINRPIEVEMRKSYIDYAMSVIVGRALPDVRDGLKPVHRKILFGMSELGAGAGRAHKKSARIVGEVLGKYHPHGDIAIYDALVRMAQNFSMRYPLIDGQGNFGSVDGDTAAAMRYTECRLSHIAEEMLQDIEKETVRMVDNFDATLKEPEVLPSKFPNLIVNGTSGIAVGMATNMPPHNLSEIVDGIKFLIDNPEADLSQLMQFVKGPDFPTGGIVYGLRGLVEAYTGGRGRITVRARTHMEEDAGRHRIIVDEIPYQVNKSAMLEDIARLVKEKRIDGISDLRDESDRSGMRIVIELKREAIEDVVLNQLFTHSQMEVTFSIINIALVNNEPKVLSLKELMRNFIDFRREIVRRRTEFDLRQAKARMHIVEGLMVAIENIDRMIELIKSSSSGEEARQKLTAVSDWSSVPLKAPGTAVASFRLSDEQAKAILDMRLQKLTGLEMDGVRAEYSDLISKIEDYTRTLSDESRILSIIKTELDEIKEKYGDARRTEINSQGQEMSIEDLIPDEEVVVTVTNRGYVKRVPLATYERQHRGGKGLTGVETHDEDFVVDMFVASTHNYILFITNRGRAYWLKTYAIPAASRHSPGRPIVNLLPRLEDGERVIDNIPLKSFDGEHYLLFSTRRGKVKKTPLAAYSHVRSMGIIAVGLDEGDEVIGTVLTDGRQDIMLATRDGYVIRFSETDVRPMGRQASGVRGIRLRGSDEVVSMECSSSEGNILLTITENGYGKPSWVGEYRKTRRGGKGVITIKTTERNGKVVAVREFNPGDEVLLTSESGMVIRIPVEDIRVMGRNTQGVRIMKLEEGDRVTAMTRLVGSEVEERVMEEGQREEELKRNQQPAQKQPDLKVDESKIIEPKERETDE
ncbi:MAG: DNA gyrase subunit A [Thermoplasmata archaeon YP2-bin.285]|uniref:DNA gyrase subunit A n=2 Tax=Candidatus Sysuiplasma superficiale TaxID=2823368 RepID=A0A8J8CEK9_9ARCH|nr:DNA gyrase subunit A [Candidatus Sysuiplasma superficiale]